MHKKIYKDVWITHICKAQLFSEFWGQLPPLSYSSCICLLQVFVLAYHPKSASQRFIGPYHRAEEQWKHGVAQGLLLYTGGALLSKLAMFIISFLKASTYFPTRKHWVCSEMQLNTILTAWWIEGSCQCFSWHWYENYIHDDRIFLLAMRYVAAVMSIL